MARYRLNFLGGQITADGGSTLSDSSSPSSFAQLPTILSGSGDYMPLIINPSGTLGNLTSPYSPEIVYVIAHATNSSTVTVIRECEGTLTPGAGWAGASWIHSYTRDDFPFDSNLVTNGDFIAGGTAAGWAPTVTGNPDLGHWVDDPNGSGWGIAADQYNGSGWTFSSTGSFGYQIPPFYAGASPFGSPQSAYVTLTTTAEVGQGTLASNLFPVFPGEVIEVTGFVYTDNVSGVDATAQVSIAQSTSTTSYSACSTTTLTGTPTYHLPTVPVAAGANTWIPFSVTSVMNGTDVAAATVVLQGVQTGTGVNIVAFAHVKVERTTVGKTKIPGTVEEFSALDDTGVAAIYGEYAYVMAQAQTLGSSGVPSALSSGIASYGNYYNHIGNYVVLDGAGRNLVGTGTSTLSSNSYTAGNQLNQSTGDQGTEEVTLTALQSGMPSHSHTLASGTASLADSSITFAFQTWGVTTQATYGASTSSVSVSGTTDASGTNLTDLDFTSQIEYLPGAGGTGTPSGDRNWDAGTAAAITTSGAAGVANIINMLFTDTTHTHTFSGSGTAGAPTISITGDAAVTVTGAGTAPTIDGTVTLGGSTGDTGLTDAADPVGTMAPFTTVYFLVKV